MNTDLDYALSLQMHNFRDEKTNSECNDLPLTDARWETLDPNPDVRILFLQFDERFFNSKLCSVEVRWSPRMTLCAGLCHYEGRGGLCSIRLSTPLLKLRPRSDLIETLLHEMIHAYLFVTQNNRDRDGHGPEFCKHMNRINKEAGTKITIYHSFHDEVDSYRQHIWRCDGVCQQRKPFFGYVRRAMNRAPSKNDPWFADHQRTCAGTFHKIKEPEEYTKKKEKTQLKKEKAPPIKHNGADIRNMFSEIKRTSNVKSNTVTITSEKNNKINNRQNDALSDSPSDCAGFGGNGITLGGSLNNGADNNNVIVRKIPGIGVIRNERYSKNLCSNEIKKKQFEQIIEDVLGSSFEEMYIPYSEVNLNKKKKQKYRFDKLPKNCAEGSSFNVIGLQSVSKGSKFYKDEIQQSKGWPRKKNLHESQLSSSQIYNDKVSIKSKNMHDCIEFSDEETHVSTKINDTIPKSKVSEDSIQTKSKVLNDCMIISDSDREKPPEGSSSFSDFVRKRHNKWLDKLLTGDSKLGKGLNEKSQNNANLLIEIRKNELNNHELSNGFDEEKENSTDSCLLVDEFHVANNLVNFSQDRNFLSSSHSESNSVIHDHCSRTSDFNEDILNSSKNSTKTFFDYSIDERLEVMTKVDESLSNLASQRNKRVFSLLGSDSDITDDEELCTLSSVLKSKNSLSDSNKKIKMSKIESSNFSSEIKEKTALITPNLDTSNEFLSSDNSGQNDAPSLQCCPICQNFVESSQMNAHLDECLTFSFLSQS